ncbi:MAG: hypothetical protein U0V70_09535 [Terriglobia bacterium]
MHILPWQKNSSLCILAAWMLMGEIVQAIETQTSAKDQEKASESGNKAKKVYTNSDLEELKKTQPINQSEQPAEKERKGQSSKSELDNYRDLNGHDREYWRQKVDPLRTKLNTLDSKIEDLEHKMSGKTVSSGLKVSKSGKLHASSGDSQTKMQQKMDDLKLQRTQIAHEIEGLEERARKAHALPDWLR